MREILIRTIVNEQGVVTCIQITKQTHRCMDFSLSKDRGRGGRVFIHNGFELKSYHGPQVCPNTDAPGLFVRGNAEYRDDDILEIPSQEWLRKCAAAIVEYNIYHTSCDWCKERHCNSCKLKN